jgi:hypothetical protein
MNDDWMVLNYIMDIIYADLALQSIEKNVFKIFFLWNQLKENVLTCIHVYITSILKYTIQRAVVVVIVW